MSTTCVAYTLVPCCRTVAMRVSGGRGLDRKKAELKNLSYIKTQWHTQTVTGDEVGAMNVPTYSPAPHLTKPPTLLENPGWDACYVRGPI
jgi:hypothetical protein